MFGNTYEVECNECGNISESSGLECPMCGGLDVHPIREITNNQEENTGIAY